MKRLVMHAGKAIAAAVVVATVCASTAAAQQKAENSMPAAAQRGKYLVQIAGCNDCHTAGYAQTNGKVDERQWLTGDKLGWRGPWGTTRGRSGVRRCPGSTCVTWPIVTCERSTATSNI
jgi:hypothetical protein